MKSLLQINRKTTDVINGIFPNNFLEILLKANEPFKTVSRKGRISG